ncbi:DUF1289 domain-containing protein [Rhizobium sp. UBA1881]|uniref:DUF1289 domain-containing protein n=1 Tax=Rhizobium sp. UBA1881 TaxID=1947375 RepID=UPI0025EE716F|nr:DUF1289 domain-containing protein [Rhizobium sp. UBA1881]
MSATSWVRIVRPENPRPKTSSRPDLDRGRGRSLRSPRSHRNEDRDPCIDICQFDARNRWCVGCARTVEEIRGWRKLTAFRRTALCNELKHRMNRLRRNV